MYSKLAFGNVKKSIKDYTIYFLTLTFGVCLFYVFNSIDGQQAMLALSDRQNKMMELLNTAMGIISVFISVVLGFLIIYANKFLVKRRKKELGLYLCLGMEKGGVSRILILETMLIGLFALAIGLVLGIFLSQGLAVLTASMFQVQMKEFNFTFSLAALGKSVLYFGVIFLIVMVFNMISVSKYKLVDLLTAQKKNEKMPLKKLWVSVLLFLCSLAFLGAAYYFIIDNGMLMLDLEFWGAIVCGTIGTFLFFFSLSGFLLRVAKSCKGFYYRNLNMFVLRQVNSKITTTYISMTLICIMLLLSIGALSAGLGMGRAMDHQTQAASPFDASILYYHDTKGAEKSGSIIETAKKHGLDLNEKLDQIAKEKQVGTVYVSDLLAGDFYSEEVLAKTQSTGSSAERIKRQPIGVISLSDYNSIRIAQGMKPVTLKANEYLVNGNADMVVNELAHQVEEKRAVTVEGKVYQLADVQLQKVQMYNFSMLMDTGTIVLPDEEVKGLTPLASFLNLNYKADVKEGDKIFLQWGDTIEENGGRKYFQFLSRQDMIEQNAGLKTVISYLAIYIGIVFLITSAAVLALQQLSESSDNVERYNLLRKIGTEEKLVHHALRSQIGIYFLMPLALALVHSVVGLKVVNGAIQNVAHIDSLPSILFTAVTLVVIYGAYAMATYLGSKGMLRGRKK